MEISLAGGKGSFDSVLKRLPKKLISTWPRGLKSARKINNKGFTARLNRLRKK